MYAAITNRAAATTADVKFNDNVFFDPDGEKVRAFIRKMGFDLHEICMSDYLPDQITSLNGAPEAEPVVRDIFRRIMLWEFTVTERATMNPTPVNTSLPFKVVSEVKDGIFGNHTDSNGILIRSATDTSPYYVVGFRSEKGDHTYRYYGCTSAAPSP